MMINEEEREELRKRIIRNLRELARYEFFFKYEMPLLERKLALAVLNQDSKPYFEIEGL